MAKQISTKIKETNIEQENAAFASRLANLKKEDATWESIYRKTISINETKKETAKLEKNLNSYGEKGKKDYNEYLKLNQELKDIQKQQSKQLLTNLGYQKNIGKEVSDDYKRQKAGFFSSQTIEEKKKRNKFSDKSLDDQKLATEKKLNNLLKNSGGAIAAGVKLDESKRRLASQQNEIKEIQGAYGKSSIGSNLIQNLKSGTGTGRFISGVGSEIDKLKALGPQGVVIKGAVGIANTLEKGVLGAFKMVGSVAGEVANLVGGDSAGIGGGKISGKGATSILGGLQDVASALPFIGGLVGGLIGLFKTVLDFALGVDQANTNVARSLNMSKESAEALRERFDQVAISSGNSVINSTRMLELQMSLGKQLGVNNILSNEALETSVKLKDIAGLEDDTIKSLNESSLITGKTVEGTTKQVSKQVDSFKKLTGISFNLQGILSEAGKLSGVLGLRFAEYPDKIAKALQQTKALGFSLQQLNGLSDSFLDFQSSISKEFEAQVLTGKNLNLEKAREAALNGNLADLAKEITNQVGSSQDFLKLNVISQNALAESVGMTRDSLADTLKQQEVFRKLGADGLKDAEKKLATLRAQGKTEAEINKMLGEDSYNYITQTSTAEQLSGIIEKLKTIFVDFITKSHILDFLTDPEKIKGVIKGAVDMIAGAVRMVGSIVASLLEGIGHIPFTDTDKWLGYANSVRSGTGNLAGVFETIGKNFGGPSLGSTVESNEDKNSKANNQNNERVMGKFAEYNHTTVVQVGGGRAIAQHVQQTYITSPTSGVPPAINPTITTSKNP